MVNGATNAAATTELTAWLRTSPSRAYSLDGEAASSSWPARETGRLSMLPATCAISTVSSAIPNVRQNWRRVRW